MSSLRAPLPRTAMIAGALAVGVCAPAVAAWSPAAGGNTVLNVSSGMNAADAAVTSIADYPYAAWREFDGVNHEVRVSRLTPAGWQQVGAEIQPASPINHDSLGDARSAAITAVGGVPYVAWLEFDGVNNEVRVARLTADGRGWERVGHGMNPASPINAHPGHSATGVEIAEIGGVPYVAWTETDPQSTKVRVSRLRADGQAWEPIGGPLNVDGARNTYDVTIALVAGRPHVAWAESMSGGRQVRVARLNDAGSGWIQVGTRLRSSRPINVANGTTARNPALVEWAGRPVVAWSEGSSSRTRRVHASILSTAGTGWEPLDRGRGINFNRSRSASTPDIAVIAGQLWATWAESDGTNREVRAARTVTPGGNWSQMAGGRSPINHSARRHATGPTIVAVGVVPYVAWTEPDAASTKGRVARLQPDFIRTTGTVSEERVAMATQVRNYGLPYRVGFQISGSGIARATRPGAVGGKPVMATAVATGLRSGGTYQWRPYAVMGAGGLVSVGRSQTVRTSQVARLVIGTPGAKANRSFRFRSGRPAGIRVRVNLRSRITITVKGPGGTRRVTRAARAGINPVRLKLPRRVGVYRLTIQARASGNRVTTVRGRIVVLPPARR